jgi:hypothetical protein
MSKIQTPGINVPWLFHPTYLSSLTLSAFERSILWLDLGSLSPARWLMVNQRNVALKEVLTKVCNLILFSVNSCSL